jgi:hypothetical protein
MNKVYQALTMVDLGLKVEVPGEKRRAYCHFTNGRSYPEFVGGKFRTTDRKIQQALESHPAYGSLFVLEGQSGEPDVEDFTFAGIPPAGDHGITDELVYHVSNAGQAKQWLKENKGAKPADMKNIQAIDEFCAKVKVVFPDWLTNRGQ